MLFIQLIYSCFSRNLVSTISTAPCSVYKPYTTHNSFIRSDEGLTLETSAFQSLYGGQFRLSTLLTNQIIVYYLPHDGIYRPEKKKRTPLRGVPGPRCFLQLIHTQRSMPHWKSAWGTTSLLLRASCLRGRYFEHVLINLPTKGRHVPSPVPLEEFRHNKATNQVRHPESHLRRQAFSRNGRLCNAVNHERQRRRQYKRGEDS